MNAIVGFIDLLATKESSRVSQLGTEAAITNFLKCLIINKILMGDEICEIRCLSDSAFFQVPDSKAALGFLQRLRKDLFDQKLYFKCGLVTGQLDAATVDANFISSFLSVETVQSTIKGRDLDKFSETLSESVKGFYFSKSAVEAYELHESFKGIGYIFSQRAETVLRKHFVSSIYFADDRLDRAKSFSDLTFDNDFELGDEAAEEAVEGQKIPDQTEPLDGADTEMATGLTYINTYLRSLQISTIKNKSYTKYYLPTLISMIRASSYSRMRVVEGEIVGAPTIYKLLVQGNALGRMKPQPKGINRVLSCMLDTALNDLGKPILTDKGSKSRGDGADSPSEDLNTDLEEARNKVCDQFSKIPNFVNSIHESHEVFLSPKNREYFLDCVVK